MSPANRIGLKARLDRAFSSAEGTFTQAWRGTLAAHFLLNAARHLELSSAAPPRGQYEFLGTD